MLDCTRNLPFRTCRPGTLLLLAFILLAGGCASPPTTRTLQEAQEGRDALLPAALYRNYFLAEVYLEDKGPYTFVLDTGASHNVIDVRLVGSGSLPAEQRWALLDRLACGPVSVRNARVLLHDMEPFGQILGLPIHGILGFDCFVEHVLTLDYGKGEARMRSRSLPDAGSKNTFALVGRGRPYMNLEFQGKRRTFLLDSGSGAGVALIHPEQWDWKFPLTAVGTSRDIRGSHVHKEGRLKGRLDCGPLRLIDPTAQPDEDICLLGHRVLSRAVWEIDGRNQRIRITPLNGEVVLFAPVIGLGVMTRRHKGQLVVKDVLPDSPAAIAGLKANDILLSINGHDVEQPNGAGILKNVRPGDEVIVEFVRGGATQRCRLVMKPLVP